MKIVHFNTTDCRGGAAKVAFRLHKELTASGYDSSMLVGWKYSKDDKVKAIHMNGPMGKIPKNIIDRLEVYTGLQYLLRISFKKLLRFQAIVDADVIHMHNFHGGQASLRDLKTLLSFKPVVWTLHDMWPITGHCAYSLNCERWMMGCGKCPYMSLYPGIKIDTSGFLWRFKKKSFNDVYPLIITPSRWLKDKVEKSILSHCRAKIIHNAVDDSTFYPLPKTKAREQLGLTKDDFILLFAVQGGSGNSWKGFTYAVEALKQLQNSKKKVTLICLGNKKESESLVQKNVKIKNIGYVESESSMRTYYSAADAYLLPSMADNSPLGIIESLACGTPVVAFDIGGIPELVDHLKTGYIAEYKNAKDLSNGIEWLMNLPSSTFEEMSKECVHTVKKKFTLKLQMKDYLDAYRMAQRGVEN